MAASYASRSLLQISCNKAPGPLAPTSGLSALPGDPARPHADGMWQDERALVGLSRRECLALLRTEVVGRAVFTERALPAVIRVSYAVLDDALVFATRTGSRLAAAAQGGVLALEVDRLDPPTRTGWSVVVTGLPEDIVGLAEQARALSVLDTWAPGRQDLLLRLPLTVVSGRQIVAEPFAPAVPIG
jgi:nitroimidazol reductase NimA-like FMN-containing flavoprotein (pyridoxamine 5'-phosphate oxidase superfamily)